MVRLMHIMRKHIIEIRFREIKALSIPNFKLRTRGKLQKETQKHSKETNDNGGTLMKKLLTIGLTLVVGAAFLSGCGQTGGETTATTSGSAGASQSASDTNVATGNTDDIFVWEGTVITGLTEAGMTASEITIPDTATEIGSSAMQFAEMKTVVIGANVTKIGKSAFWKCKNLESVTIPGSVQSIGNYAFSLCQKLTSVTLSEGLKEIGNSAFQSTSVEVITIPEGVTTIGEKAFNPCADTKEIYLPASLETMASNALGFEYESKVYVKEGSWADLHYEEFVPVHFVTDELTYEKVYY